VRIKQDQARPSGGIIFRALLPDQLHQTPVMRRFILFSFFSFCLYTSLLAQDGALDPTFGTGGRAYGTAPSLNASPTKTVVQPDGKIVIVGRAANCCGYDFATFRFLPNGSLDASFGGTGVVITEFAPNAWDIPTSVAVQPDGKILAAGYSDNDFAIVRFALDGTLDPSFNGTGKVKRHISGSDEIYDILLQPDGKIVVAGVSGSLTRKVTLARYLPDGTPDNSFGTGGLLELPNPSGAIEIGYALARQGDGKIVVAGQSGGDFLVVRVTAGGQPDGSFGTNGRRVIDFGGEDRAHAVALQPDGKIVAVGVKDFSMAIARLTADGALDNSFNGNGTRNLVVGGSFDTFYGVLVQQDGKIVASGSSYSTTDDFAAVRFLSNGALDPSFGNSGVVLVDMGGSDTHTTIAGWGNFLVLGGYSSGQMALARLTTSSPVFILPLRLLSFTGAAGSSGIALRWQTGEEQGTDHFGIEHSGDGVSFNPVGRVAAAGNSNGLRQYGFLHGEAAAGRNFYRLKMVDRDGRFTYSPVIPVEGRKAARLTLLGNPVREKLEARIHTSLPATVQLLNAQGVVVRAQSLNSGTTLLSWSLSLLPAGVYQLQLLQKGERETVRVVKQ
jgi:uncharacterized delta-60 repeat protein